MGWGGTRPNDTGGKAQSSSSLSPRPPCFRRSKGFGRARFLRGAGARPKTERRLGSEALEEVNRAVSPQTPAMSRRRPAALASLIIRSIAQRTSVAHRMSLPGRRGTRRRRRRKRKRGPPRLAARHPVEEIPLSDDALPFSGASRPVTEVIPDPVPLGIEDRFFVAVLPVNVLASRAHLAYE